MFPKNTIRAVPHGYYQGDQGEGDNHSHSHDRIHGHGHEQCGHGHDQCHCHDRGHGRDRLVFSGVIEETITPTSPAH